MPESAKPEPEKLIHDNEVTSVRRNPIKHRVGPKYLDDYVVGKDLDDAADDDANCTIDFCYRRTNTPQLYQDAISFPDYSDWKDAVDKEFNALWENETFELTSLSEGQTSVGGKRVYAIKPGPNGEEQYKERFLAKGYSLVPGVDYYETSPTARITSVRLLIQLAV